MLGALFHIQAIPVQMHKVTNMLVLYSIIGHLYVEVTVEEMHY